MDDNVPNIDPNASLTVLAQCMAQMHELFQASIDAGFTEQQAMAIVLETIRAGIARG